MGAEKTNKTIDDFLSGKTVHTLELFQYFVSEYRKLGAVTLHPAKTMIGISNGYKRIAWVTQFGKNFVHVVFPFVKAYPDNLCFVKIAQVPGDTLQFNHHFRLYNIDDVNKEVITYMKLAYNNESQ